MPVQQETAMAKLILQGLVSPARIADLLLLQEPLYSAFIEETERLALVYFVHGGEDLESIQHLADKLVRIQTCPKDQRKEVSILSMVSQKSSGQHTTNYDMDSSLDLLQAVAPSLLFASSVLDVARDPRKSLNRGTVLDLTKSGVTNAQRILQNTALSAVEVGTAVAAGVGTVISLVREYQYQQNIQILEASFQAVQKSAEETYFSLHKAYADIAALYQKRLEQLKDYPEIQEELHQRILQEWLSIERYLSGAIVKKQQEIATAGALTQKTQSQRRIDRASDAMNTALTLTALAGPPGLLASTIVKGVASLGRIAASSSIEGTAQLNHGVIKHDHVLMVRDKESVKEALKQLKKAQYASVALSGPELRPQIIAEVNVDTLVRDAKSLAKKMVTACENRTSCSFSFSNPLPALPEVEPASLLEDFSNNPDLKKQGKEALKQLIDVEEKLYDQITYLTELSKALMQAYKPHPYVVNIKELCEAIECAHRAAVERRTIIQSNMGEAYIKKNGDGVKLLHQLASAERAVEEKMANLRPYQDFLEDTPHAVLFERGTAHQTIVDTYAKSYPARVSWLHSLHVHLDGLMRLTEMDDVEGKYVITNLSATLGELEGQLKAMQDALAHAEAKGVTAEEKEKYQAALEKLKKLSERSMDRDKARVNYLLSERASQVPVQEKYQELVEIQQRVYTHLDRSPASQKRDNHALWEQIEKGRVTLSHALEKALEAPTPIDLEQMQNTEVIVVPNRTFFGVRKHTEMQEAVTQKVKALKKTLLLDTIQIMPLQPIDENVLGAVAGDYGQIAALVEGLKTEIQWVAAFREACHLEQIHIGNLDKLIDMYQKQITFLEKVCANKSDLMPAFEAKGIKEKVRSMKKEVGNVLHENITHSAESELVKMKQALASLKNAPHAALQVPKEEEGGEGEGEGDSGGHIEPRR